MGMKLLRGGLALVLAYALGVQPAVAQVVVRLNVPSVSGSAAAAAVGTQSAGGLSLATPALTLSPAPALSAFAPAFSGAPSVSAPQAALAAAPAGSLAAAVPAP